MAPTSTAEDHARAGVVHAHIRYRFEAAHFSPPLTTMRQDFEGLGRDAMVAVLAHLQDDLSTEHPEPRASPLILRSSTRAV